MTIEFSLRQRAAKARWLATMWLSLAVIVLAACYISFPLIADETLRSVNQLESCIANSGNGSAPTTEKSTIVQFHVFAIIILILCLFAVSFASYLLARTAFIELESAARFIGLADAICIAGDDFDKLQKAATLLVPTSKYFPELSEKNLKSFLEIVKSTRG
jgi:hypothetical protein